MVVTDRQTTENAKFEAILSLRFAESGTKNPPIGLLLDFYEVDVCSDTETMEMAFLYHLRV